MPHKKISRLHLLTIFFAFLFVSVEILSHSFLKGVALSAYQNGGDKWGMSNWSIFESQKSFFGNSPIKGNQRCGDSAQFWDRAFDDIVLIQELGCNAVRFSIEWAGIEPLEGIFNEQAFEFYEKFCDALIAVGITPMITLYHFTHPAWFEKKGAWENEENIAYFLRYCTKVFERLSPKVHLWCTINEPTVYSFMGYILGMHSPGKYMKFQQAGTVLCNLLKAHTATYKTLKKLDNTDKVSIGIVHQLLKARAYSPWYITGKLAACFLNFCAAHEQTMHYLKTGIFEYKIPGILHISYQDYDAPTCYDFIGLNYYSRVVVAFGPTCYPNEIMTDMEYPIYPQGIYDAIREVSSLKVPIYITENGIADASDTKRSYFIESYLSAVQQARENGYDVRGYFYWTLMDNFEWDRGFSMKFGLYEVDFTTQERKLRQGAKTFKEFSFISSEKGKSDNVLSNSYPEKSNYFII
jgi:beta-glucosidase